MWQEIGCLLIITSGFQNTVHHLVFYKTENTLFQDLNLFPSSGEKGGGVSTQMCLLERASLSPVIESCSL